MKKFAVAVRLTHPETPRMFVGLSYLTGGRPSKAYIVDAETSRRAENIVKKHLKAAGVEGDPWIVNTVPAEII